MPIPALFKGRLALPLIGSPMFLASGPELVLAQCKAGVAGSFPTLNARTPELLAAWLERIEGELADWDAQHTSGQFLHHPSSDRASARYAQHAA